MRLNTIVRNINLLNIVLIATIAAFAAYLLPPLLNVQVKYTLPSPKKAAEEEEENPAEAQPPEAMEYMVIAEQNIFHPERKIPVEKKEDKPLPKPEFVLYGTLITGDTKLAFIDDMKSAQASPGRGKRQRALNLGSTLSGFTLSEVYQDKVVMVRGEESIEVRVLDSAKSRAVEPGGIAAKKPTAVSTLKQPSAQPARPLTGKERKDLRQQTRSQKQPRQNAEPLLPPE
jgi:hypothetical protein